MKINQVTQSWIIKCSVEDVFKTLIFTTNLFYKYNNMYNFISKATDTILLKFIT
jgi:hypothetical protein